MPSHRVRHLFALSWHWRKNIKKLIQSRVDDAVRRRVHVNATSSSRQSDCPLCKEYFIPNEVTRRAIGDTEGSLTFADAKSAFAFLMEEC